MPSITPPADFTLANLQALDAAIQSGASEVRFQDRTVRYKSAAEMLILRTLMVNQIYPSGASPSINRVVRMRGSKGL